MAKRDDEDSFLDEEIGDWDEDDTDVEDDAENASEAAEADESAEESDSGESETEASEEAAEELEVEEEIDYPPDDEKAVAALRKLRVRLDVTEKGNVWRAIFDDTNGKDQSLVLLGGLPALKELWVIGTMISPSAVEQFKEERPKVTVY